MAKRARVSAKKVHSIYLVMDDEREREVLDVFMLESTKPIAEDVATILAPWYEEEIDGASYAVLLLYAINAEQAETEAAIDCVTALALKHPGLDKAYTALRDMKEAHWECCNIEDVGHESNIYVLENLGKTARNFERMAKELEEEKEEVI